VVAVLGDFDGGLREDGGLRGNGGGLRDLTAKAATRKSTLAVLDKPQHLCGSEPPVNTKTATSPECLGNPPVERTKLLHARTQPKVLNGAPSIGVIGTKNAPRSVNMTLTIRALRRRRLHGESSRTAGICNTASKCLVVFAPGAANLLAQLGRSSVHHRRGARSDLRIRGAAECVTSEPLSPSF
jgi:hypothetical protein